MVSDTIYKEKWQQLTPLVTKLKLSTYSSEAVTGLGAVDVTVLNTTKKLIHCIHGNSVG